MWFHDAVPLSDVSEIYPVCEVMCCWPLLIHGAEVKEDTLCTKGKLHLHRPSEMVVFLEFYPSFVLDEGSSILYLFICSNPWLEKEISSKGTLQGNK